MSAHQIPHPGGKGLHQAHPPEHSWGQTGVLGEKGLLTLNYSSRFCPTACCAPTSRSKGQTWGRSCLQGLLGVTLTAASLGGEPGPDHPLVGLMDLPFR